MNSILEQIKKDYYWRERATVELLSKKKDLLKIKKEEEIAIKSLELILKGGFQTQNYLKKVLSELLEFGLSSVVDDPPAVEFEITERRKRIEIDIKFKKGDKLLSPLHNSGGGLLDLTALLLRISLWSIKKTGDTFVLDEPIKFLHSPEAITNFYQLLNLLSERLGIQFVIFDDNIEAFGHKEFIVSKQNDVSTVKEIECKK